MSDGRSLILVQLSLEMILIEVDLLTHCLLTLTTSQACTSYRASPTRITEARSCFQSSQSRCSFLYVRATYRRVAQLYLEKSYSKSFHYFLRRRLYRIFTKVAGGGPWKVTVGRPNKERTRIKENECQDPTRVSEMSPDRMEFVNQMLDDMIIATIEELRRHTQIPGYICKQSTRRLSIVFP